MTAMARDDHNHHYHLAMKPGSDETTPAWQWSQLAANLAYLWRIQLPKVSIMAERLSVDLKSNRSCLKQL